MSLAIREMHAKTTTWDHFTPTRMTVIKKTGSNSVGKDVENLEPSCTAVRMWNVADT